MRGRADDLSIEFPAIWYYVPADRPELGVTTAFAGSQWREHRNTGIGERSDSRQWWPGTPPAFIPAPHTVIGRCGTDAQWLYGWDALAVNPPNDPFTGKPVCCGRAALQMNWTVVLSFGVTFVEFVPVVLDFDVASTMVLTPHLPVVLTLQTSVTESSYPQFATVHKFNDTVSIIEPAEPHTVHALGMDYVTLLHPTMPAGHDMTVTLDIELAETVSTVHFFDAVAKIVFGDTEEMVIKFDAGPVIIAAETEPVVHNLLVSETITLSMTLPLVHKLIDTEVTSSGVPVDFCSGSLSQNLKLVLSITGSPCSGLPTTIHFSWDGSKWASTTTASYGSGGNTSNWSVNKIGSGFSQFLQLQNNGLSTANFTNSCGPPYSGSFSGQTLIECFFTTIGGTLTEE